MPSDADDAFYERADAHIHLSNDQLSEVTLGKVSASTLYGAARFNAWVSAGGFSSSAEMAAGKPDILKYFVDEYAKMLEENVDDYIAHFDQYMKPAH
jgi:Protein of unknown function (DUF3144)